MTQRLRKQTTKHENHFPPEADGEFDVVESSELDSWRDKLATKYKIGTGHLKVVEEPAIAKG